MTQAGRRHASSESQLGVDQGFPKQWYTNKRRNGIGNGNKGNNEAERMNPKGCLKQRD